MTTGYKPPTRSSHLSKWLSRTSEFNIEYQVFLSNHLAHYLVVLGCLGLDEEIVEERMKWWWDVYRGKGEIELLSTPTNEVNITNNNWFEFVNNDMQHYAEFLRFFEVELQQRGVRAVVREYVPYVFDGLAGAALHPVIHLGFGLEAGDAGISVVAQGLAYLCCRSLILCIHAENFSELDTNATAAPNTRGLLDSTLEFLEEAHVGRFADLSVNAIQRPPYSALTTSGFQKKMRCFNDTKLPHASTLAALVGFKINGVDFPASDDWLAEEAASGSNLEGEAGLAEAVVEAMTVAAAAYLASNCEFFVIHGVTSLHSVLVTMEFLPLAAQVLLLRHWWRAAMATLVSTGLQGHAKLADMLNTWHSQRIAGSDGCSAPVLSMESDPWWINALEKAITSTDEHPAKAVYVLWRWSLFAGMPQCSIDNDIFKAAAASQLRTNDKGGPEGNMYFA